MKLSDNIYLLEASRGSYVYLIKGEETVLIDTGLPFRRKGIISEIKALCPRSRGDPAHSDHPQRYRPHRERIRAAAAYGCKNMGIRRGYPGHQGEKDRSSFKKYLKYFFPLNAPEAIKPYRPGESICGIEIIPTPGHTPGHVCLRYGDMLSQATCWKTRAAR